MLQLILEFIVRTGLIAGVTAAVLHVMNVRRAAVRHAVWAGVVVVMLLLPEWLIWGPKAYLRVLPPATNQAAGVATAPRMLVSPTQMPQAAASPSGAHPAPRWPKLVLGLYLLGLGVLLARLTIGTARAHALARRAVNRTGRLTSASCAAPITVGWLHPVVILPEHWFQWPAAQMDAVWTHELEHARRRDPLVQWVALFNRAVFWFHPIAWWIERELSALAEEACDAAVLESGHDPREYSECLLQMARSVMQAGARVNVGMTMPGSFLPQRIRKILEGGVVPQVSRARMTCAVTACAVMSAALAAGTLAYVPQRGTPAREQQREFDTASKPPEVRVPQAKPKATAGTSEVHILAQAQSAPAAQVPPETRPRPDAPDYTLGPIDQLLIRVPQAAEIDDHPFRIDAAGDINLPLLGRVHASGMTIRELEADLVQRLREHVSEPQVSIMVVQFHAPAPVYFVGAFKAPGTYPLQGSGRLAEMLTATGGLRPGAGDYIKISRRAEYGVIPLPKAIEDAEKKVSTVEISVDRLRDLNPAEDIPLLPLDVVSVEPASDR
jgi:protein involved in polysaccharide export with SLBB domain/beta-lactamase regulating signal transducer with metallopeptidase domain